MVGVSDAVRERRADPLLLAAAARGQPLHEDQAPDGRRAAAGDVPLHLRLRRGARLARSTSCTAIDYVVFVVPGLIMMAWAMNAFSNNSSSILQQKFQRAIDDQLSSPASPLELLLAFTLGGFLRGMTGRDAHLRRRVAADRPAGRARARADARRCSWSASSSSQLGVLVGVRAEQFDDVSFAQTFVLQPLIFLGGVFYSRVAAARALRDAHPLQPGLLHDRPRPLRLPRLLGDEHRAVARVPDASATAALFAFNLRLFKRGYKLRA